MRYSTENDVRLDWNGFDEMLTGDDEMPTLKGTSKNSEFAQMQGAEKFLPRRI